MTPSERFWPKVNKDGPIPEYRPDLGPCWIWTACIGTKGYGQFYPGAPSKRMMPAHQWAYIDAKGPIPTGLKTDHLCRVRSCVNPDHLEAVTNRENLLRGDTLAAHQVAMTHCIRGHPLSGDNLAVTGAGHRACRACSRERNRKWQEQYRMAHNGRWR